MVAPWFISLCECGVMVTLSEDEYGEAPAAVLDADACLLMAVDVLLMTESR